MLVTVLRLCWKKNGDVAGRIKYNKVEEFEGTTSFLNVPFVLHLEALCTEGLQLNHVMDNVTRTVD